MATGVPVNTPLPPPPIASSIEAKLVILGAQGVGKTSLVHRYLHPNVPLSPTTQSTVGASFVTKRLQDSDSSTTVRLQIWDTAGQERFRSISRLYYRGANAGLLCYDITDEKSWEEMKGWLRELKENSDGETPIIHVVGTKSDIVAEDPSRRQVPFERTIAYVAEQLDGVLSQSGTPPLTLRASNSPPNNADSKRSSGFWTQEAGWDSCHEISAKDGEGIEEVFRVIARKLIDQRNKRDALIAKVASTPGYRSENEGDYFAAGSRNSTNGSFRLGHGDKRRSWLGLPSVGLGIGEDTVSSAVGTRDPEEARRKGRCC